MDIANNPRIEGFASQLNSCGAHLKFVDLSHIHMTLKFLGDTKEEHVPKIRAVLEEGLKNMEPFKIELRGCGAFPSLNYIQVIWIGALNAEMLGKIAFYLEDELEPLGYRREKRGFSPHITIARVKSARNMEQVKKLLREKCEESFGEQIIDSVKLKKSELTPRGPIYTTVEEVKLG